MHATNPLGLSASSEVFDAATAEDWSRLVDKDARSVSFRSLYNALFSDSHWDAEISSSLESAKTVLDIRVVLECVHALIRDNRPGHMLNSIVFIPSIPKIRRVLMKIFALLNSHWSLTQTERLELLVHWHFVCIEAICDTAELLEQICHHFAVKQDIFRDRPGAKDYDAVIRWAQESSEAKSALLHSTAMQSIINQLPLTYTFSLWMPTALLAAATIYNIFRFSGVQSVSIPGKIDWAVTLSVTDWHVEEYAVDEAYRMTENFIKADIGASNYSMGSLKNLPFDIQRLHTHLRSLATQWGFCSDILATLTNIEAARAPR